MLFCIQFTHDRKYYHSNGLPNSYVGKGLFFNNTILFRKISKNTGWKNCELYYNRNFRKVNLLYIVTIYILWNKYILVIVLMFVLPRLFYKNH